MGLKTSFLATRSTKVLTFDWLKSQSYCCRKVAVCIGDQLLDFSVPELVRSQPTFCTGPEVLQNCAGFTWCSSAGLAAGECSVVMGLTPCMLCTDLLCVVCIGLLSAEFATVKTGLGRPMFWKPSGALSEELLETRYNELEIYQG